MNEITKRENIGRKKEIKYKKNETGTLERCWEKEEIRIKGRKEKLKENIEKRRK